MLEKISIELSIIVPCYNLDDVLADLFISLLNFREDLENVELIFVNDGSADNTLRALYDFQDSNSDLNVHVFSKENGGLSSARNCGLRQAQGKFVWFLDGDDKVLKIPDLTSIDADLIFFSFYRHYANSNMSKLCEYKSIDKHSSVGIVSWLNFAWNKVYRRSFLIDKRLEFMDGLSFCEDIEFMSRVLMNQPSYLISSQGPLLKYMIRPRSTLSSSVSFGMINVQSIRYRSLKTYVSHLGLAKRLIIEVILRNVYFLLKSILSSKENSLLKFRNIKIVLSDGLRGVINLYY